MHRQFVRELAQKAHTDSMRQEAEKLLNASDDEIIKFLTDIANSYYCACNYCEEKTAARIVLKDLGLS